MTPVSAWQTKSMGSFLRPMLSLLAIVAAATAVMLAIRFYVVEPEEIALACAGNATGWRCALREFAVFGFLNNAYGIAALIFAVLATVARSRWLAALAMIAGIAGAVLYTFELSGVGLLFGALVWVHRAPTTAPAANEDNYREHQA